MARSITKAFSTLISQSKNRIKIPTETNPSKALVGAFWDMENLSIPRETQPSQIFPAIHAALKANHFKGDLEINGFAHKDEISRWKLDILGENGISFEDVKEGTITTIH